MRVSVNGVHLHVDMQGKDGTVILLLHGLGGSSESWRGVAEPLSAARRVIALDLRGCGRSEPGEAEITLDLLALDALGVARCHLMGHSLGGVIAEDILTRHGERCLSAVLISTSSTVGEEAARNWRRLADRVEAEGIPDSPEIRGRMFAGEFAARNPAIVNAHGQLAADSDPAVYAAQARAASEYDYTEALAHVPQPVLIIQGLADKLTRPGGSVIMARRLPHAELEMVEGVGHNAHIEMGHRFIERVERFLDAVEAGS
jgi:pimeloyl-ACP methyl ester carboxylesterase